MFLFSCASYDSQQTQIPAFKKEEVCSKNSINYLNKQEKTTSLSPYKEEEIHSYMMNMSPLVRACYENEMARTGQINSFNLCLIVGLDKKGKKDFFEFSTSEISITKEMKSCLNEIKSQAKFGKLKDVSIIQNYRLSPKK